MVVLSIIGIVVVLIIAYAFIIFVNNHSLKKYNYEIFNAATFFWSFIGYLALFFGYDWYESALINHEDILNGELMLAIGAILLCSIIYYNISRTSLFYGLLMSIVTEAFYLIATPCVIFIIIIVVAYFSQTKPVFNVND